ncbi:hypothetical protein CCHR01_04133 [Colletotrichum chrysophilum]|uniref:Uncharacterized protein n=1 Tax=Colletotrichum chrysophilum TaxID=1836956 RepID=A0AAD9ELZ1_9PEZI|nr:hypothetical protein CCHR01_04133 [Colletotrichum chrysophilum]
MDRRSAYVPSTGVVLVVILGSVAGASILAGAFMLWRKRMAARHSRHP